MSASLWLVRPGFSRGEAEAAERTADATFPAPSTYDVWMSKPILEDRLRERALQRGLIWGQVTAPPAGRITQTDSVADATQASARPVAETLPGPGSGEAASSR